MIQIKPATPADTADIHALWHKGFGDEAAFVDSFYRRCCPLEHTFLLREDGALCSMIAAPAVDVKLPDGTTAKSAYLYALTTDPACRSKGFGQMILKYVDFYLTEHGLDCVVLVPAEPSLFQFFHTAGFDRAFSISEIELPAGQVALPPEGVSLRPAHAAEYNRVREARLEGSFHVACRDELVEFQRSMSRDSGGDLYLLDLPHGQGCAAVERVETGLMVKELLADERDLAAGVSLLAQAQLAPRYFVRYPIFLEGLTGDYGQAFGVIKWYDQELAARWGEERRGYLGLAFD